MKQAKDFRDESDALYQVLAPLSAADFLRATQFKGWTLNDIVSHLHVWNRAADAALNEPDAFQRFLAKAGPALMAGNMRAVEHEQQGGHAGMDLVEIWRAFYLAMADRFAEVDPKTRIQWAGPSMSVRSAMTARQMETWAHGQAIFDALGIERTDTDRIGNIAVLGVKTFKFNFANRKQTPPGPVPHVRLTAPSGDLWEWNEDNTTDRIAGPATQFCQVVTQVRNEADTRLEVTGEVARAWMTIAQCFAGPATTRRLGARGFEFRLELRQERVVTENTTAQNVLISGGTSGINLGIAEVFAAAGANVSVFGRDPNKARQAAKQIEAAGAGAALGLAADVREPDAVTRVIEQTVNAWGELDVVIAGAAGNFPAPAIDISPKGFKTVVDIDLLGTYNVFRLAFDHLRKPGASLIAITAPQATRPWPMQAHVGAAKAGINMLVQCLALEWGAAGIRVNAISPGPIADTEGMARLAPTPEIQDHYRQRLSLKRFGHIHDIGHLAVFLSSDKAGFITGGIYPCDGGTDIGDASMDCLTSRRR